MQTLKVHVEKAVRPIRAMERRKDRMREDLFAHITEIYHHEFERLREENLAIDAAIQRLGAPQELTEELQQTVPTVERILCFKFPVESNRNYLKCLMNRKPGESILRYSLRISLLYEMFFISGLILCYLVKLLNIAAYQERMEGAMSILVAFLLIIPFLITTLSYAGDKLHNLLLCKFKATETVLHALLYGSLSAFGIIISGLLFMYITPPHLKFDSSHNYLILVAALVSPIPATVISRFSSLELQRYVSWGSLDIAE